ncbi:MAG: hypothetical protein NZM29_05535 [Nitrospira sp.]|nr:hypothetical protein [Nitrospira sp.]
MKRFCTAVFLLALALLMAMPDRVDANPVTALSYGAIAGARISKWLKHAIVHFITEEAFRQTWGTQRQPTTLNSLGDQPVPEDGYYFGVTYLLPKYRFTEGSISTVLGQEVPGRQLTVEIRVDCEVDCRVKVSEASISWIDQKTLKLTLPEVEVIGRVPKGRVYEWVAEHGALRVRAMDADEVTRMRKRMLSEAAEIAAAEFKKGQWFRLVRESLRQELTDFVMKLCPSGTTVIVKYAEEDK